MNFDDIRAYSDEEIPSVIERLTNDKQFINLLSTLFPLLPKDILKQELLSIKSTYEFQKRFAYPFLKDLEANRTRGISFEGVESIDKSKPYLYISNHRDITLDSVLLCLIMIENGMDTMGIAIGDNLMIYPWIEDFVRINKGFVVKRSLNMRKALEASQQLSAYIRHLITDTKRSIWIAQREGRSKDSKDCTQESLLRMLTFSSNSDFYENFSELHICPLTISYEFDPTDYLKAKEFQLKRDNPEYKKQPQDDLINMQVGILGYRGRVVYRISGEIDKQLKQINSETTVFKEQITSLAKEIDKVIHSNYAIFNVNKIAHDLLKKEQRFAKEYTSEERSFFEQYISNQISKIDLENKDLDFLRMKILEMYANPLLNKLEACDL